MADKRSYTAGRFFLEIAHQRVAYMKKFDGLAMEADISTNDLGPDNFQVSATGSAGDSTHWSLSADRTTRSGTCIACARSAATRTASSVSSKVV